MGHTTSLFKMHLGRGCVVTLHEIFEQPLGDIGAHYTLVRQGTLSKRQRHKKMAGVFNFVLEQALVERRRQDGTLNNKQEKRLARRRKWMDKNICLVI